MRTKLIASVTRVFTTQIVIWTLGLLLLPCSMVAQADSTRFSILGLEGGLNLYRYTDPVEMTLPQKASSFTSQFSWHTFRPRSADFFSFSYSNATAEPLENTQGSGHTTRSFLINYAFYFPVLQKTNTSLFIGPATIFNVAMRDLHYASGASSENHEFFVALEAAALLKVDLRQNFLILSTSQPMLALVTERKYALHDIPNTDLLSRIDFRSGFFRAMYYHQVRGALFWSLGYQWYHHSYGRHDALPDTRSHRHQWVTGLQIQFEP